MRHAHSPTFGNKTANIVGYITNTRANTALHSSWAGKWVPACLAGFMAIHVNTCMISYGRYRSVALRWVSHENHYYRLTIITSAISSNVTGCVRYRPRSVRARLCWRRHSGLRLDPVPPAYTPSPRTRSELPRRRRDRRSGKRTSQWNMGSGVPVLQTLAPSGDV